MALVDVVEYSLVEIAYIIIVRFVTLTKNLVADDFFPRSLINCLISLIGSMIFLLKRFKSKDSSFSPYFSMVFLTCFVKSSSLMKLSVHIMIIPPTLFLSVLQYHKQGLRVLHCRPAYTVIRYFRRIAIHRGNSGNVRFHG